MQKHGGHNPVFVPKTVFVPQIGTYTVVHIQKRAAVMVPRSDWVPFTAQDSNSSAFNASFSNHLGHIFAKSVAQRAQ